MNKTDLLSLRLVSCRFDDHLMPCIYRRLVREVLSKIGTHLHRAATICYDLAIQRLLSAEISVDCRDDSGETALHVAARNNCLVSVRRLLSAGAKVDARSYHQWTPLQLAARYGHVSILRELIGAGADINLRGFHGWTALYYGARSGDLDVTEVLLSAGAEAHSLDNDRRTAAQEAITYGHQEVLGMLEKFAGGQESSG
jgi:ankyrin repeat protein